MYAGSVDRMTKPNVSSLDTVAILRFAKAYAETRDQMAVLYKDSTAFQIKKDSLKTYHLDNAALLRNDWHLYREEVVKAFADTLLKMELAAPASKIQLFWLSGVATFNRKKYWFYNEAVAFNERITRVPFTGFNWGAEVNYYSQLLRSRLAHFASFGFKIKQENDIADFSTSTVNQKTKTSDGSTEREVVKTYSAYTDIITEFGSWFFYMNYYLMFKNSSLSALHLFPEIDARTYKGEVKKNIKI